MSIPSDTDVTIAKTIKQVRLEKMGKDIALLLIDEAELVTAQAERADEAAILADGIQVCDTAIVNVQTRITQTNARLQAIRAEQDNDANCSAYEKEQVVTAINNKEYV